MRLALFQPDIPQNLGAAIRLCSCLSVGLDVIAPCAFPLSDRNLKRAALDYGPHGELQLHASWTAFLAAPARKEGRLVLFTTRAAAWTSMGAPALSRPNRRVSPASKA